MCYETAKVVKLYARCFRTRSFSFCFSKRKIICITNPAPWLLMKRIYGTMMSSELQPI